jgi:UDP-GlcNAc:undecaprenyl-phosphate/decaprenyl-phosphate GlcNAc-1-phosphate transferase
MRSYLLAFLVAMFASLVFTRLVRDGARRLGWTDKPDSIRKIHTSPTPAVGGIAIYLALVTSLGVVCFFPTAVGASVRGDPIRLVCIIGSTGLMMLLGLVDDLRDLSAWTKFTAQVLLSVGCWFLGFQITTWWSSGGSSISLGLLSLPLTILWIVGITNAFNLIDGVDGLSSGAALFATLALLGAAVVGNQWLSALILSSLAGATIGFLRYNFNPASIFLGDSGSLSLGFILALVAIEGTQKSSAAVAIGVPIVAFGFPVIDTAMAIIRRFISGKPIFAGDYKHIHHMLLAKGLTPRRVVILLYGVCALFGLFSLLFLNPMGKELGLVLSVLGACIYVAIQQLHYPEFLQLGAHFSRSVQNQRKLIAGSIQVGRAIDVCHSAKSLAELLENLSNVFQEMDFRRVEVHFPCSQFSSECLQPIGWQHVRDGGLSCLFRWTSADKICHNQTAMKMPEVSRPRFRNDEFKLEGACQVPKALHLLSSAQAPTEPHSEAIRIAFFHPTNTTFAVSAICLLSQDIWNEMYAAIERLVLERHCTCPGLVSIREVNEKS